MVVSGLKNPVYTRGLDYRSSMLEVIVRGLGKRLVV